MSEGDRPVQLDLFGLAELPQESADVPEQPSPETIAAARTAEALRPGYAVLYQFDREKISPNGAVRRCLELFRRKYGPPSRLYINPAYELDEIDGVTVLREAWVYPGTLQIS